MKHRDNTNLSAGLIGFAGLFILAIWFVSSMSAPSNTVPSTQQEQPVTTQSPATPSPVTKKSVAAPVASGSVLSLIQGLTSGSQFAKLLTSTGVSSLIEGGGPFTIFVPTNAAFNALPSATLSSMTAAQQKRLVEYHIVQGRAVAPDANISGSITALSRDMINFITVGTSVRVNSTSILKEYTAGNGIVYLIDGVLLPPVK